MTHPAMTYAAHAWEREAARRGVSTVARSGRGFMRAYQRAGTFARLPDAWKRRREAFIARHMAQGRSEALWKDGKPSRRALALIMWAYMPPGRARANPRKSTYRKPANAYPIYWYGSSSTQGSGWAELDASDEEINRRALDRAVERMEREKRDLPDKRRNPQDALQTKRLGHLYLTKDRMDIAAHDGAGRVQFVRCFLDSHARDRAWGEIRADKDCARVLHRAPRRNPMIRPFGTHMSYVARIKHTNQDGLFLVHAAETGFYALMSVAINGSVRKTLSPLLASEAAVRSWIKTNMSDVTIHGGWED